MDNISISTFTRSPFFKLDRLVYFKVWGMTQILKLFFVKYDIVNETPLIRIDAFSIRNLLNFLNKTTYKNDLKIVMIDNAELLNLNSSNALLKSIEEPNDNVLFFIIHNNPIKILDTIKSRCTEFKFFLSISEKKFIFNNIAKDYKIDSKLENYTESLYFNTPGSLLKYALFTQEVDEADLNSIDFFIDKFNDQKNPEFLFFLSVLIEKFYLNLCKSKKGNLNQIFLNYSRILNQINSIKKFNLSEKNIFISIKNKIINETR